MLLCFFSSNEEVLFNNNKNERNLGCTCVHPITCTHARALESQHRRAGEGEGSREGQNVSAKKPVGRSVFCWPKVIRVFSGLSLVEYAQRKSRRLDGWTGGTKKRVVANNAQTGSQYVPYYQFT